MTNNVGELEDHTQMFTLYDGDGAVRGFLPDLIWREWLQGRPSSVLGEHDLKLDVPSGWHLRIDEKAEPIISVSAKVQVSGAVVSFLGQATQHALVDASERTTEKFRSSVSFDTSRKEYPVKNFSTESELEEFLASQRVAIRLTVGRIRAPRMQIGPIYWPPSERTFRAISDVARRYEAGEVSEPSPQDLANLEGSDLRMLWDPVWPDHPMLRKEVPAEQDG